VLFTVFLGHVFAGLRTKHYIVAGADRDIALAVGVRASLVTLLFVNILTGFVFVFGHFWLVLGLALAFGDVLRRAQPTAGSARSARVDVEDEKAPAGSPVRAILGTRH
jgi:type IV secretory pathway TrbD component